MTWAYRKLFSFLDTSLSLLPYLVFGILVSSILIVLIKSGLSFEQLIELLNVVIWPTIVLMSLLFFRKVFTYLFFSIEEFNFFGAKGKLKNVRAVVSEKAQDMYESRLSTEKQKEERRLNNEELESLKNSQGEVEARNEKIYLLAERVIKEKEELFEQNNLLKEEIKSLNDNSGPSTRELQTMINDLLAQVDALQKREAKKPVQE